MKLIVTSGYFDPIHKGHIECLKLSKEIGDKLIVILNNDKQAVLKKGKPFMELSERKAILEAIRYVDEVFVSIDEDESICESLRELNKIQKIDVFAKGGDRFSHEIPEAKVCNELSINIVDGLGNKIQSSRNFYGPSNPPEKLDQD